MGKRELPKKEKTKAGFSKKLIDDVRALLWVVTLGGILLAFYCVHNDYTSSLPWITSMVGLPWAAHATICSFYLVKSKAENTDADGTGIVYAAAKAKNFMEEHETNIKKYVTKEVYTYSTDPNFNPLMETEEDYSNSPPI